MIGIYNIDKNLQNELSKYVEVFDMSDISDFVKIDGLLINWVSKDSKRFVAQGAIIEHYVRESIPVVIYDRWMSVTGREFGWLKKFNVSFLEPALNNRPEFEYLPQWSNLELEKDDFLLEFDLGYTGPLSDRIKQFEKYYRRTASLYPDMTVSYSTEDNIIEKTSDWRTDGLFHNVERQLNWNVTVLIDSIKNIEMGYMYNGLFKIMEHGIMPLCPEELKYFHGMFEQLIVRNAQDVSYFVKSFKDQGIRNAVIDDIFKVVKSRYPEFTTEYACDTIKRKLMI